MDGGTTAGYGRRGLPWRRLVLGVAVALALSVAVLGRLLAFAGEPEEACVSAPSAAGESGALPVVGEAVETDGWCVRVDSVARVVSFGDRAPAPPAGRVIMARVTIGNAAGAPLTFDPTTVVLEGADGTLAPISRAGGEALASSGTTPGPLLGPVSLPPGETRRFAFVFALDATPVSASLRPYTLHLNGARINVDAP